MYVWYHLSTIFNQRRVLRLAGILTLCVAFITMLFFSVAVQAAPGINKTISFQGRLLTSGGTPVPNGFYNIEFKIYQDGTGTAVGNPGGQLKWTESYVNNDSQGGVKVTNGYMSVNLGSQNPFGNSIDWNQDTLWLSMNIAGLNASCSTFNTGSCIADGEMTPMKRLTATPYSLNSGMLDGKTSDQFLQRWTGTGDPQNFNFNFIGGGQATILQGTVGLYTASLDNIEMGAERTLSIGNMTAETINMGMSDQAQTISIGSGSSDKTIRIGIGENNSVVLGNGDDNAIEVGAWGERSTVTVGSKGAGSSLLLQGGESGVTVDTIGMITLSTPTTSMQFSESGLQLYDTTNGSIVSIGNNGSASFGGTIDGVGEIAVRSDDSSNYIYMGALDGAHSYIGTTSNEMRLQGSTGIIDDTSTLDYIVARAVNGEVKVSIGSPTNNDYALNVAGDANVSNGYAINGASILNSNSINFSGETPSTIAAAEGQTLNLSADSGITIGDGNAATEATLFQLDRSDTAPTATGDALLGSMYYDTTLGKVQCYEADGWGTCSSSPDNFVTLSPEYSNAVTNGTGVGTMTSDLCSDTLNINDASTATPVCGTNETYNYYNWTSTELTPQTKSIYVTYQLPANFTEFVEGSTSLAGRTDTTDATVSYEVFKNTTTGLIACGTVQSVSTGPQTTWQKVTASGAADPFDCTFSAGDSLVFKINLTASNGANAYASTLNFAFKDN